MINFDHFSVNFDGAHNVGQLSTSAIFGRTQVMKNGMVICSRKVCQVNIIVRNVNDWKPIAAITHTISIPEDTKPGTIIGQVNATDFDKRNKFSFRLLGQESEWFKVHRRTGKIQLLMALDREISDYYRTKFYFLN